MNGAHDLGGRHGFDAIDTSQQVNFEHEWEQKVFALTLACGMLGKWNLDQSRFARERCDPAEYLAGSYYEHWLHGLELLLVEQGLLTEAELREGSTVDGSPEESRAASPQRVDSILSTGGPTLMDDIAAPRFAVGDVVVVKPDNTSAHTRAPGYVKGKAGQVVSHHGSHIYADEHAASGNKTPAHLYCVKFDAQTLWGDSGSEQCPVYADLFEPYLISLQAHLSALQSHVTGNDGSQHG
ncbi:MAG: nitrile hydratase subunit beta [Pseudomonadota bacterium]